MKKKGDALTYTIKHKTRREQENGGQNRTIFFNDYTSKNILEVLVISKNSHFSI